MNVCHICKDPNIRAEADRLLVQKASVRDVAAQVNLSKSAIDRHKRMCLAKTLASLPPAKRTTQPKQSSAWTRPIESPQDYSDYMQHLQDRANELLSNTFGSDNYRMQQVALKEARDNATALAKAKGFIADAPAQDNRTVNLFASMTPDALLALRSALMAMPEQHVLPPAIATSPKTSVAPCVEIIEAA